MATQKHMGRHSLLKRLTAQVGDEGTARSILIRRGHMTKSGALTAEGMKRDAMTAEERAKDRAAKRSGGKPSDYTYNRAKNSARLRKR
jgi:hypothetical protein